MEGVQRYRSIEDDEDFDPPGRVGELTIDYDAKTYDYVDTFTFAENDVEYAASFFGDLLKRASGSIELEERVEEREDGDRRLFFLTLGKTTLKVHRKEETGEEIDVERPFGPMIYRLDRDTDHLEAPTWPGKIRWYFVDEDD